jgi:hypothetical protein
LTRSSEKERRPVATLFLDNGVLMIFWKSIKNKKQLSADMFQGLPATAIPDPQAELQRARGSWNIGWE